jgi:hypothetical protein
VKDVAPKSRTITYIHTILPAKLKYFTRGLYRNYSEIIHLLMVSPIHAAPQKKHVDNKVNKTGLL